MKRTPVLAAIIVAGMLCAGDAVAQSVVSPSAAAPAAAGAIDFANAAPMPLPKRRATAASVTPQLAPSIPGAAAVVGGATGDGKLSPVRVAPRKAIVDRGVASQQFGTSNHPFSTARVQLTAPETTPAQFPTVQSYPYRASGKLYFKIGGETYFCSASLIKRGLVVTAAHCVVRFGGGDDAFYTNFEFIPAYNNGLAPYGVWTGTPFAVGSYVNGSDFCAVTGVVCLNDVAVIRLTASTSLPNFPGTATGWYGYARGDWGFARPTGFSPQASTLVNQLGYPAAIDDGQLEQRNDSMGYRDQAYASNTIIGSLMTGGSSGGPWLNNLGVRPALNGTSFGSDYSPNIVIGVTSWGYIDAATKEQGASPFTKSNIFALVDAACGSPVTQPACQ